MTETGGTEAGSRVLPATAKSEISLELIVRTTR